MNEERVKPARGMRGGEFVTVRRGGFAWVVEVIALSDRRGGAEAAALLYRETPASIAAREDALLQRRTARAAAPETPGRPTKRQRRKLEDFLNEP